MNPSDNNPFSSGGAGSAGASGASGSSPFPSPVDFTSPDAFGNTSALSMSDSLASAQDDLTSAGQAAVASSNTVGLDQLDLKGGSVTTTTSSYDLQPLVPAAPVPGSIGSAMSAPAPTPATENVDASNIAPAAPVSAPVSTAPSMSGPFGGAVAPSAANATPSVAPMSNNMPNLGGASSASTAPAANGAASTSASAQEPASSAYYNPFARNTGAPSFGTTPNTASAAPASSTAVPPALQPQAEKFSENMKMAKKSGSKINVVSIISWALVLVLAVLSVVFFMKWQDAEDRAKKTTVIYKDKDDTNGQLSTLSCKQDVIEGGVEGLENLVSWGRSMTGNFVDGKLDTLGLLSTYVFTDMEAVEAAKPFFEAVTARNEEVAAEFGIAALDPSLSTGENTLNYNLVAKPEQLVGGNIATMLVGVAEDGTVLTSQEDIKNAYQDAGFVCTVSLAN